jgi:hypothetical protein
MTTESFAPLALHSFSVILDGTLDDIGAAVTAARQDANSRGVLHSSMAAEAVGACFDRAVPGVLEKAVKCCIDAHSADGKPLSDGLDVRLIAAFDEMSKVALGRLREQKQAALAPILASLSNRSMIELDGIEKAIRRSQPGCYMQLRGYAAKRHSERRPWSERLSVTALIVRIGYWVSRIVRGV